MRRVLWAIGVAGLLMPAATRAALPDSIDAFEQRIKDDAGTPEGALHLWFEALFVFNAGDDESRELGAEMLNRICSDDDWSRNEIFLSQLKKKPYIFRSYADGSTPENDYQMNPDDFSLLVDRVREGDDTHCTMDLRSNGAERLRPVPMLLRDGHWWVDNIGNLYAGVKDPDT